jgi:acyl-CoA synthetase (AMP-forming)/AMP-acid ligase II
VIAPADGREIRLDWREFDAYVNRWANALAALGVARGDRVATVLPNAIELVAGYWACFALGAAAVPLSTLLNAPGLASLLGDATPRVIVSTSALRPVLDAARAAGASIVAVFVVGQRENATGVVQTTKFGGPVLIDDGTLRKRYAVTSVPYTLVLRPDGSASDAFLGQQDAATLQDALADAR